MSSVEAGTTTVSEEPRQAGVPGPVPLNGPSEIRWAHMDGNPVVVKVASGAGRSRLRREAEVLQRLPNGLAVDFVELTEAADHTELVTTRHGSCTLDDMALLDRSERSAALRSLCEKLDALHAAGWVHGALAASHVLVEPGGAVRFTSLADSTQPAPASTSDAVARDNAELATLVLDALEVPPGFARGPQRLRSRWAARRATKRLRHARGLRNGEATANVLRSCGVIEGGQRDEREPTGRSGSTGIDRAPGPAPRWSIRWVGIGVICCLVAGATIAQLVSNGGDPGPPGCSVELRGSLPDCEDATVAGNAIELDGVTFEVGAPEDQVLLGDWDCDGTGTALLLEADTGRLFHFERWSTPEAEVPGDLVGSFNGATGLVADQVCGYPQVRLADGSLVEPLDRTIAGSGSDGAETEEAGP